MGFMRFFSGKGVKLSPLAEAPCRHAVEMAQAALADGISDPPLALTELASIREKDAEEACHSLFEKYRLTVSVSISKICVEDGQPLLPVVRPSDWMRYILDHGHMDRVIGVGTDEMEPLLEEFWARLRPLQPEHQIWVLADNGQVQLRRTLPMYCHLDEGRTYKSKALMVMSVHGAVGRGTRNYVRRMGVRKRHLKRDPMGLNFVGSTWATQFFYGSLLRAAYSEDERCLEAMLADFATDMSVLAADGVWNSAGTERVWVQLLGVKGDLPALTKIGGFNRSFFRGPKAATSKNASPGVCWLCMAGAEHPRHIPFEDFSLAASWRTEPTVVPWSREPTILGDIPLQPSQPERFFLTDLWHNWHNGLAKIWTASVIVMLLYSGVMPGNSIPERLKWMSGQFTRFCRGAKITPHMREFTRDNLSFETFNSPPQGLWSKASVSTHVMLFLQSFFGRHAAGLEHDPLFATMVPACSNSTTVPSIFFESK